MSVAGALEQMPKIDCSVDDEARLNWCTLYCAMYVFSVLQYIPCYAHGGVARLTGNLKQIYNQITMLCNKYTYIYRTTQGHTITTQPQYRRYTSPDIPIAHSTVAILVQSFLRSIVGPPSCRRSTVDPPGCRLSHRRFAQF